jgi:ABC-type branched-subunit amino acid transport system permease subunit
VIGVAGALATKYVVNVPWLMGLPASLPFLVLFVALVVTPRAKLDTRSFVTPRRIPRNWHAPIRARLLSGTIFVAVLCVVPWFVGTDLASYTSALILVMLILSLGLLIRTSRQVSLCQYAFAAIGAAAMAHLTSVGIPWFWALLVAALVAVPVGAIVAIPAVRLSGVFLALATLGFGILLEQIVYTQSWMFGPSASGLHTPRPSFNLGPLHLGTDEGMYFLVLAFVVIIAVGVAVLSETRLGKLLRAMGDSHLALDTYGVSVNVMRVLTFCITAFMAALAGALTASVRTYAIGDNFPSFSSLTLVVVAVVVVVGSPWYAFIAAGLLTLVPVYVTGSNVSQGILVLFGVAALFIPIVRHRIRLTPRSIQELVERMSGRPSTSAVVQPSAVAVPARLPPRPALATSLAVENLTIRYGGALAVDDASLAVRAGTITGLIGPNGAGKTSIFNACSGLLRPTSGKLTLHGVDITRASPSQRARARPHLSTCRAVRVARCPDERQVGPRGRSRRRQPPPPGCRAARRRSGDQRCGRRRYRSDRNRTLSALAGRAAQHRSAPSGGARPGAGRAVRHHPAG